MIDIDDRRPEPTTSRTRDGLIVTVEYEPDYLGAAGYAGTLASLWERNCPGLWSEIELPFELTITRQRAFSTDDVRIPRIGRETLKRNLSTQRVAKVPKIEQARLMSNWDLHDHPAELCEMQVLDGLWIATITVQNGSRIVARDSIAGVSYSCQGAVRLATIRAVELARERFEGGTF